MSQFCSNSRAKGAELETLSSFIGFPYRDLDKHHVQYMLELGKRGQNSRLTDPLEYMDSPSCSTQDTGMQSTGRLLEDMPFCCQTLQRSIISELSSPTMLCRRRTKISDNMNRFGDWKSWKKAPWFVSKISLKAPQSMFLWDVARAMVSICIYIP